MEGLPSLPEKEQREIGRDLDRSTYILFEEGRIDGCLEEKKGSEEEKDREWQ